jgi:hypothetical protein
MRWVCAVPAVQRARKQLSGSSASGSAGGTIEAGTAWVTRGCVVNVKSRGTSLGGEPAALLRSTQQKPVAPAKPVVNTVVLLPGRFVPRATHPPPPQVSSGAGSTVLTYTSATTSYSGAPLAQLPGANAVTSSRGSVVPPGPVSGSGRMS